MQENKSEAGHWYTADGEPAYTVERSDGKGYRNTTLRDAKKLGLLPSVTTILSLAAKPLLQNWLQQQAILAALTLPRNEGESEDDYLDRVMQDSKAQGRQAADQGRDGAGLRHDRRRARAKAWPCAHAAISQSHCRASRART